ncbi:arylsulfatase A-like enzyme [Algoriphagus ratkowskyi]|uniref:Sulfatase n=1 Tax=Algoriphagus ratkowskyi TaxID=57028 RepID=A0A2W7RS91_9BACT|nr:sulfatase [Algoriphagus ratkowskyi]PZX61380.1 arylsulfatase A-like enzyme [Algoriphagus ratkowskyi]TXD79474.1 sulfatase [Algoriphagus ratkowskyi]
MRYKFLNHTLLIILLASVFFKSYAQTSKPNVLFIAVDDLRSELGHFENSTIITPNLDKLASEGVSFSHHFVQVPTCGASRAAFLTGKRPSRIVELGNNIMGDEWSIKPESENPETFIHHLRRNGYHTVGIGKISHSADGYVYGYEEAVSNQRELPYSWDEMPFDYGQWETGWNAFFAYANGENRQSMKKQVKPYEAADVDDLGYPDGLTTQLAIKKLRELKNQSQPFFLGVGLFKPHLPFTSPQKYWDLYDEDQIPVAKNPRKPKNVANSSLQESGEFNGYELGEEKAGLDKILSDDYARKIKHAYYAAASYSDAQIGLILDELTALELDQNTIVIVWGDHGWHLGEQQIWGKHTLFENALNSALIFKIPGSTISKIDSSIVESVDIYPTLLELLDVKTPGNMDGDSFASLLKTKESQSGNVAYSYYNKGISVRTDRYRLTKYFRSVEPTIELYDHQTDPLETINIAEQNPKIVTELMPLLEKGNTGLFD